MRLRAKSIDIYITYPALCLFSGLTIIDYNYFYCFLSVIIHETAHLAAMVICKSPFCGVKISVFEIKIIEKSRHILDYKRIGRTSREYSVFYTVFQRERQLCCY